MSLAYVVSGIFNVRLFTIISARIVICPELNVEQAYARMSVNGSNLGRVDACSMVIGFRVLFNVRLCTIISARIVICPELNVEQAHARMSVNGSNLGRVDACSMVIFVCGRRCS